ncbi:uncharacterized protein LOC122007402 [Zingiber officinale]|uniref:uncharacterized protein LOC122007402 n=1 Tax=Zingiber officinale TaxID=94328 RepID=UPI001C4AB9D3|nr:uncharacterized protein LOC122007402 [Zingiber officinale]
MDPEEQVPFSTRVLGEKLPKGYRPPAIGEYDGSHDPEDHLRKFRNATLLHQYSDVIKRRVFLNTLSDSTQKWFDGLPNGCITCFHNFKTVFLRHFANSRKNHKTDHCLFTLKQEPAEPLRSYIKRFNQVAQDVPSATSEILMSVFSHELIEGEFFRDLIRDLVTNFDEMLGEVASYINVEETQATRRKADKVPTSTNKPEKRSPQPPAQPLLRTRDARPPFGPGLDTRPVPRVAVVQALRPGSWGPRYCTYHRSHTHATSGCLQFARDSRRAAELDLPPPEIVPRTQQRILTHQQVTVGAGQPGRPQPDLARQGNQQPGRDQGPGEAKEEENRGNTKIREIGIISGGPTNDIKLILSGI